MYFCQMKQTISIILIGLLFASCKKVPKCWDCTRTVTFVHPATTKVINFEKCDMTKLEINDYEKTNTIVTDNISSVTDCR